MPYVEPVTHFVSECVGRLEFADFETGGCRDRFLFRFRP